MIDPLSSSLFSLNWAESSLNDLARSSRSETCCGDAAGIQPAGSRPLVLARANCIRFSIGLSSAIILLHESIESSLRTEHSWRLREDEPCLWRLRAPGLALGSGIPSGSEKSSRCRGEDTVGLRDRRGDELGEERRRLWGRSTAVADASPPTAMAVSDDSAPRSTGASHERLGLAREAFCGIVTLAVTSTGSAG